MSNMEKRLNSVVEWSSNMVLIFDNEEITYVNDAGKELLGEDVTKKPIRNFFPDEEWNKLVERIVGRKKDNHIWSGESVMMRSDGTLIVLFLKIIAHKDEDSGEMSFSLIGRDLSDVKKRELELIEAKKIAEEASERKSLFLANMTHEIRAPLNAILGFSELLGEMSHDKTTQEYCQAIKVSGKNLLGLVSDILDLSKIESGNFELRMDPMDLEELLEEVKLTFILAAKKKGLELDLEKNLGHKFVYLDELRLRQVLFNLVGNSVKYTDHGKITIICEEEGDKWGQEITLVFKIKDTGKGIRNEDKEKIFTAFTQCHDRTGGVGLGLSIVRKLVTAMGGTIEVESEVGKGSVFKVVIPGVKKMIEGVKKVVVEEDGDNEIAFENPLVLIADDLDSNIQVMRAFLEGMNVRFLDASNGHDTVMMAKMYKPDVVLMDLRMPDMDGYDATKELKRDEETKNIPVVAITGRPLEEDKERAIDSGATDLLRKPITRAMILKELKKLLPFHKVEKKVNESN